MGWGRRTVADVVADACEASTTHPKPPTKSPTAPIRQTRPTIMGGLTRVWRKTGHTGRDRGVPTAIPRTAAN
jgi:hypothetical protein